MKRSRRDGSDATVAADGDSATAPDAYVGAGMLLQHIRDGAVSRADLVRWSGLARSTVAQRVDALLAAELVVETPGRVSTGGRPPGTLTLNAGAGVLLAAELGAASAQVAVTDLLAAPMADAALPIELARGPDGVLHQVGAALRGLLEQVDRGPADVRGIGVAVPDPVVPGAGDVAGGHDLAAWASCSIPEWFAIHFGMSAEVDAAVGMMAVGERALCWPQAEHLLFVHLGAEIGCGIVSGGRLHRGADGAAGDIGHVRLRGHDAPCRCGATGCLEAVAGARAIAARLQRESLVSAAPEDLVRLVEAGEPAALRAMREAGRALGEVLATVVNLFGPEVIVLGGPLAEIHAPLLAGARELIHQRAAPLATRTLVTTPSRLGANAAVVGLATSAAERLLAPDAVDRALGVAPRRFVPAGRARDRARTQQTAMNMGVN